MQHFCSRGYEIPEAVGNVSQITLVYKTGEIGAHKSNWVVDQWASRNGDWMEAGPEAGVFLSRGGEEVVAPFPDMERGVDDRLKAFEDDDDWSTKHYDGQPDWFQPAQSFRSVPRMNENGLEAYAVLREANWKDPNDELNFKPIQDQRYFADELHFRGETGVTQESVFEFYPGVQYYVQQGENWRRKVGRAGDNVGIVCVDVVACVKIPFSYGFEDVHICSCDNGEKAEGTACTRNGAHICTLCNDGFYISCKRVWVWKDANL